jgi:hypothetical protein
MLILNESTVRQKNPSLRPRLPDFFGKYYPNQKKCTKWVQNEPNGHKISQNVCKIFQMAIKYIHIFLYRALQDLPKLGFLVWKETIWQPCPRHWSVALDQRRFVKAFYGLVIFLKKWQFTNILSSEKILFIERNSAIERTCQPPSTKCECFTFM